MASAGGAVVVSCICVSASPVCEASPIRVPRVGSWRMTVRGQEWGSWSPNKAVKCMRVVRWGMVKRTVLAMPGTCRASSGSQHGLRLAPLGAPMRPLQWRRAAVGDRGRCGWGQCMVIRWRINRSVAGGGGLGMHGVNVCWFSDGAGGHSLCASGSVGAS